MTRLRCAVLTLVLALEPSLLVSVVGYAQQADEPFEQLLAARTIRCDFVKLAQAAWDAGQLTLEMSEQSGFGFTFDSVDVRQGTGRIIGNAGADDVSVLRTIAGLTMVEQTPAGNLNFTTVYAHYSSPLTRQFIAVHSRHITIGAEPFPSQHHGTCRILEYAQP